MAQHKDRFLASKHAKDFVAIVDGEPFKEATNAAMLELVESLTHAQDMGGAAANSFRLEGARRYKETLSGLPVPAKPRPQPRGDNLPHE